MVGVNIVKGIAYVVLLVTDTCYRGYVQSSTCLIQPCAGFFFHLFLSLVMPIQILSIKLLFHTRQSWGFILHFKRDPISKEIIDNVHYINEE